MGQRAGAGHRDAGARARVAGAHRPALPRGRARRASACSSAARRRACASPAGNGSHFLIYSFNRGPARAQRRSCSRSSASTTTPRSPTTTRRARCSARASAGRGRRCPGADTGAWSRYSAGGAESDLGYHRLVRDFLRSMCERTKGARVLRDRRPLPPLPAREARAAVPARAARTVAVLRHEDLVRDADACGAAAGSSRASTRVLGRGAQTLSWAPRRQRPLRASRCRRRGPRASNAARIRTTVRVRGDRRGPRPRRRRRLRGRRARAGRGAGDRRRARGDRGAHRPRRAARAEHAARRRSSSTRPRSRRSRRRSRCSSSRSRRPRSTPRSSASPPSPGSSSRCSTASSTSRALRERFGADRVVAASIRIARRARRARATSCTPARCSASSSRPTAPTSRAFAPPPARGRDPGRGPRARGRRAVGQARPAERRWRSRPPRRAGRSARCSPTRAGGCCSRARSTRPRRSRGPRARTIDPHAVLAELGRARARPDELAGARRGRRRASTSSTRSAARCCARRRATASPAPAVERARAGRRASG